MTTTKTKTNRRKKQLTYNLALLIPKSYVKSFAQRERKTMFTMKLLLSAHKRTL